MKIKNILIITSILSTLSNTVNASSLDDAIKSTYLNNLVLQRERARLKTIDESYNQARSGFMPRADISGSMSYENRNKTTNGIERGYNSSTPKGLSLSITQPIFNGMSTTNSIKAAKYSILAARSNMANTEQSVIMECIKAYIKLVETTAIMKLSVKNADNLKEHLIATKERFHVGEVTKTDVEQAKSRLSTALAQTVKARGDVIIAKTEYKRIVGEEISAVRMPEFKFEISSNVDALTKITLKNHPSVLTAHYTNLYQQHNLKVAKGKLMPQISAVAKYGIDDSTLSVGNGNSMKTASIGLNMQFPLYNMTIYSQIRRIKNELHASQIEMQNVKTIAIESLHKALINNKVSVSSVQANQDAVKAAKFALDGIIQEYRLGTRTTLDVLDAEQEYFSTQINLISSRSARILASYQVLFSLGKLNVQYLKIDVDIYNPVENFDNVKYKMIGLQ